MNSQLASPGTTLPKPLVSGLLGIILLLPASFFLLTLLIRIVFGAKTLYRFIAPSFLQSPFDPLAWHKAQFIMGSLLLAIVLNGTTTLRVRLFRGQVELSILRRWLNMAIAIQGLLLLIVLIAYTWIQHLRY
jgi:hypothetical protein